MSLLRNCHRKKQIANWKLCKNSIAQLEPELLPECYEQRENLKKRETGKQSQKRCSKQHGKKLNHFLCRHLKCQFFLSVMLTTMATPSCRPSRHRNILYRKDIKAIKFLFNEIRFHDEKWKFDVILSRLRAVTAVKSSHILSNLPRRTLWMKRCRFLLSIYLSALRNHCGVTSDFQPSSKWSIILFFTTWKDLPTWITFA